MFERRSLAILAVVFSSACGRSPVVASAPASTTTAPSPASPSAPAADAAPAAALPAASASNGAPAVDAATPEVEAATQAAQAWLSLVDAHKYAESWGACAKVFQRAVTQPSWQDALTTVREPLGKVISRQRRSAVYRTSLPGVPDGRYVVIEFATEFENKAHAVERITPAREGDQRWRVAGYFIR